MNNHYLDTPPEEEGGGRWKVKKAHKCLVVCKKLYNFAAKFV